MEGQEIVLPEVSSTTPRVFTNSAFMRASVAGARVLVAVSDSQRARVVSDALTNDRFELVMATDGHAALAEAVLHRPDMVVVEARLPGLDGCQLIQALRSSPQTKHVPVLMLTSSLADEEALRGLTLGATDCLAEPLSIPMLRFRVRMWLLRSSRAAEPIVVTPPTGEGSVPSATEEAGAEQTTMSLEERMARRARLLADLPLFRGLPSEQLLDLARQASATTFSPGTEIIRQGDPGDALYVIVTGQVIVRASRPDGGPEALLGTLGPGSVFGEMALVDDGPRSATVRAQTRTSCVVVRRNDFLSELASSAGLARTLLLTLSNRLREADLLLAREAPDPVTGLMSRRSFEEYYQRELALAPERGRGLALLMVAGDWPLALDSRQQNDVEEEVERALADAVRRTVRSTDVIARWDTRRLVVLLSDWHLRDAGPVVKRIARNFKDLIKDRALPKGAVVRAGEVILKNFDLPLATALEEAQTATAGARVARQ
jgi:CRP/FNR family transcriptional regulator